MQPYMTDGLTRLLPGTTSFALSNMSGHVEPDVAEVHVARDLLVHEPLPVLVFVRIGLPLIRFEGNLPTESFKKR